MWGGPDLSLAAFTIRHPQDFPSSPINPLHQSLCPNNFAGLSTSDSVFYKAFINTLSIRSLVPEHTSTVFTMASDLDQLIEMGFDKERAQLAVTKTGGRKSLTLVPFT